MLKRLLALAALTGAVLALAPAAQAHPYDRDDSDHPLRLVAYVIHPVGIAVEYAVLRPIHWLVSQPTADIWFGHQPAAGEKTDDYLKWQ